MLDLALHPTRLIARRQTGSASDAARAFVFLAAAILVGNIVLLLGLDVPLGAERSFALSLSARASWLLAGELVGLLLALLLASALALTWRIADRGAVYRRVGLVAAYVYGGAWVGFCAGAVVLGSAVQLVDSGLLARVLDSLQAATVAPAPASSSVRATPPQLSGIDSAPFRGAAAVLFLLALAIWLATLAWCIAAWSAFRQAFGATRLQAWVATSLWLALVAAVLWLGGRLS